MDADQILKGADYFRCQRLHALMKKALCVEYQTRLYDKNPMHRRECCVKCPQGREILKQMAQSGAPKGEGIMEEKDRGQRSEFRGQGKTKVCSKCGEEKDISEYSKKKVNKDGLHHLCRKCKHEYEQQWRDKAKRKRGEAQGKSLRQARDRQGLKTMNNNKVREATKTPPRSPDGVAVLDLRGMPLDAKKIVLNALADRIESISFPGAM